MKYPVIAIYIILSTLAIYYLGKPSPYKLASKCCDSKYKEMPRRNSYEPYCLECNKWCELKEIREIK